MPVLADSTAICANNNNNRLKKALAQRSTTTPATINPNAKPQISQIPAQLSDNQFSSSIRPISDPFDDVIVDPHHVSVATFATYSSSSSNESTDSMLFSSIGSPSTTTCSTSFMTPISSINAPQAACNLPTLESHYSKPCSEPLSFLDSGVPPITSTPTHFNLQRMRLSDPPTNLDSNHKQQPSLSSNTPSKKDDFLFRQNSIHHHYNHQHNHSSQLSHSYNYNGPQFNNINGVNLLEAHSSLEYGKFGKIVADSVHSLSSVDSVDPMDHQHQNPHGSRRLFEKSKGTFYLNQPQTVIHSYASSNELNPRQSQNTTPQFSHQSSVPNLTSSQNSTNTISKLPADDKLSDAFNPDLYTEPTCHTNGTRNLYADTNVAFTLGSGYTNKREFLPIETVNKDVSFKLDLFDNDKSINNTRSTNLNKPSTRLMADIQANSGSSTFSYRPPRFTNDDPTDLSAAFMNLRTSTCSTNMSSPKKNRRSSFHVINSSDFNGCQSLEDEACAAEEDDDISNLGPPTIFKHKRSNSSGSVGSRKSMYMNFNLDLDSVIHNALVESAHLSKNTTGKPINLASNHEDHHHHPLHLTTSTTNQRNNSYDLYSHSSSNHYESELLHSVLDMNGLGNQFRLSTDGYDRNVLVETNSDSLANNKSNTFGKFGTSVKKFARKMANGSSSTEH